MQVKFILHNSKDFRNGDPSPVFKCELDVIPHVGDVVILDTAAFVVGAVNHVLGGRDKFEHAVIVQLRAA